MSLESSPRAKSRLAKSTSSAEPITPANLSSSPQQHTPSFPPQEKFSIKDFTHHSPHHESSILVLFFKARLKFILLLVLGLLSLASCIYILQVVPPEQIANTLFYHSYFPLLLSLFGTVFFTTSFLLLHSRRAFLLAASITLVVFFKVQDVLITEVLLLSLFGGAIVLELLFSFIFKK
jgi:hypothetical protein